jgi:hypothetical protein
MIKKKILISVLVLFAVLFAAANVFSAAPMFDLGDCQDAQTLAADDGYVPDLVIAENCSNYGQIDWTGLSVLNLTDLGEVQADEVSIGHGYAYVNSVTRPDLAYSAHIILRDLSYAYTPVIKKDGVVCSSNCTAVSFNKLIGVIEFDVSEFSNYSVTGRQDFTVYSDTEAYLHGRVYDSVNLGSSYLTQEFHCVVMLFDTVKKNLIQTNPEKKKAGSIFSGATSSESELPEIKGYFSIINGIGNVYYRDADIVAYVNFLKVIKCNSNSTELVYEEMITPQYKEPFKSAPARGVWIVKDIQVTVMVVVFMLIILALGWYIFISK